MTNPSTQLPTEHQASVWASYPAIVQETLKAQGHTIIADIVVAPAPVQADVPFKPDPVVASAPVVNEPVVDDLFAQDLSAVLEIEEDEAGTRIFLNTTIKIGKTEIRVKAAELTSEFHMNNYRDGKVTGINQYMASLISTIEKHGLQAVVDKMEITSTISASGEGLDEAIDLLA